MRFNSTVLLFFSLFALSNVFADDNVHVIEVTHVKWEIPRTITVSVLDRDGAPLADAEVQLGANDNLYRKNMADYPLFVKGKTDQKGRWTTTLPDDWFDGTTKIHSVELRVTTAKYPASPTRLKNWFIYGSKNSPVVIPEKVTVSFEGMMYPIHVVDEKGTPIEGVEVTTSSGNTSRTDSRGIYEYGPAGADLMIGANTGPRFKFYHPDYQNVELPGGFAKPRKMTIPEIVTLKRGGEISGKVLDQQGRPVVGAFVYAYGERLFTERETVTDDRRE